MSKQIQDIATALVLVSFGFINACTLGNKDTSKYSDLLRIASATPVFPGFKEVGRRQVGKREISVLTLLYDSAADYEDVKSFYVERLTAQGWSYPTEEIVPKWFTNDGSKALVFRRGEYEIEIEYDASRSTKVPYSVAFAWHLP
jgi:hypothetical protein